MKEFIRNKNNIFLSEIFINSTGNTIEGININKIYLYLYLLGYYWY